MATSHNPTMSVTNYQNMYFTTVVYVCCIASSSHVASLLVMREVDHFNSKPKVLKIRVGIVVIFAILLIITIALSEYAFEAFFVPWELFELIAHPSPIRVAIFVINLAVLWYLVWLLRRKGTFSRGRCSS